MHSHLHTYTFTSKAPGDFTAVTQVLSFTPSESNQTLPLRVPISDDMVHEGRVEMFSVRLEVPMGEEGVGLGAQDTATVTIEDDDCKCDAAFDVVMAMNYRSSDILCLFPFLCLQLCRLDLSERSTVQGRVRVWRCVW